MIDNGDGCACGNTDLILGEHIIDMDNIYMGESSASINTESFVMIKRIVLLTIGYIFPELTQPCIVVGTPKH